MRLESRVLTVCRIEQARRMHECRALGSHFLMFIPKIPEIPTVNNRDQDPPVIHSVFHRSHGDRDITNWPMTQ